MTSALDIYLLGTFRLEYDDQPITTFNSPRLQSLLAYLVLHCEAPQLRQHLAFLLWPDSSESQARTNLRKLLYQLRRALPDAGRFLHYDAQTIQWNPDAPFTLDVAELQCLLHRAQAQPREQETLAQVAELYKGELLPSCYEEWIPPLREQLHRAVEQVLERLVTLLEEQHAYQAGMRYARRLLELDPLRETAYRQLIRLRALDGDQIGALRVYYECVAMLKQELGVEPAAATQALYQQLLNKELVPTSDVAPLPRTKALTSPTRPTNLPTPLTSFIGREKERAEVVKLLHHPSCRLLTLTGTAGTGKTRLAIQVASEVADVFADGVFFVNLAPISDPALVVPTIARTLSIKEEGNEPLLERVKRHLQTKKLLLVLDNFEQVVVAGPLVSELLLGVPALKVLVTSRSVLDLYGEHIYPVPALTLPDTERVPPVDELARYEAVRLFIERAQAVKPDFQLTHQNAIMVAAICHRLDGLPLAIELAAARIRLLPPQTLLERLENRLALLTGGGRDRPARQQTLRDAIEWSYSLLEEAEQRLFNRLAIFVGGCTLEATEEVCNATGDLSIDPLGGLASLVDKSLLRQEEGAGGEPRFVMLETIHEYARERLEGSGEAEQLRGAHAAYFLALAEEAESHLIGADQATWYARLGHEHDNLRAALRWATTSGGTDVALRLAGALWRFWFTRGYLSEGRDWLATILSRAEGAGRTAARARALNGAGNLAYSQGDYTTARALYEESLAIWRELGDKSGIAAALNNLGSMAYEQGDYAAAWALYEESLTIKRELGDKWDISISLSNLGSVAYEQGNYAAARALHEESLAIWRELEDKAGISLSLDNLGILAYEQGDYAAARALYEESLTIKRELVAKYGIAQSLERFAALAVAEDAPERAVHLWGAAEALRTAIGATIPPAERIRYERDVAAVRRELGEVAFACGGVGQGMRDELGGGDLLCIGGRR